MVILSTLHTKFSSLTHHQHTVNVAKIRAARSSSSCDTLCMTPSVCAGTSPGVQWQEDGRTHWHQQVLGKRIPWATGIQNKLPNWYAQISALTTWMVILTCAGDCIHDVNCIHDVAGLIGLLLTCNSCAARCHTTNTCCSWLCSKLFLLWCVSHTTLPDAFHCQQQKDLCHL